MPRKNKEDAPGRESDEIGGGARHFDCGEHHTYVNRTRKNQRVLVTATNNCEFTAYLWIRFGGDHTISKDLKRGDTFCDTVILPPKGEVEFWCSMVATVENCGCTFDVSPLA